MDILKLIGRDSPLFDDDVRQRSDQISEIVQRARFLVIGGAGSIGQAVVREIFKRNPKAIHVVDISENNMVELVRDIRSSLGYIEGDFQTFAIDCGGFEFEALVQAEGPYDYVLNLSALKHVRSEQDVYTLMRMIEVNITNTVKTLQLANSCGARKYFCVSTDKAANPVNMMGASKRIMEKYLMRESVNQPVSTARFANVAFSDGSLLHGFNQRIIKHQPISAPFDVRRYFLTPQESGELCLMSCLFGENRDIFFPKLSEKLHLITFSEIARKFLLSMGYEPVVCSSEDEARLRISKLVSQRKWPCYFFKSDTTGEKDFEEFYTEDETLDMEQYRAIGIVKNDTAFDSAILESFTRSINRIKHDKIWSKREVVDLFVKVLPEFDHMETGRYLNSRM